MDGTSKALAATNVADSKKQSPAKTMTTNKRKADEVLALESGSAQKRVARKLNFE
jgi:hypothetical protein